MMSRRSRGAVAVETALSLVVVTVILIAGITFGHALVVRYVLTDAASRAARVCVLHPDPIGCVPDQVEGHLVRSKVRSRCNPLNFDNAEISLAGIPALQVSLQCGYSGMPGTAFLASQDIDGALVLSAQATMPLP